MMERRHTHLKPLSVSKKTLAGIIQEAETCVVLGHVVRVDLGYGVGLAG